MPAGVMTKWLAKRARNQGFLSVVGSISTHVCSYDYKFDNPVLKPQATFGKINKELSMISHLKITKPSLT